MATTCPVCEHSPLNADDCQPYKSIRTTVKVFLRTAEKKREMAQKEQELKDQPKTEELLGPEPTPQTPAEIDSVAASASDNVNSEKPFIAVSVELVKTVAAATTAGDSSDEAGAAVIITADAPQNTPSLTISTTPVIATATPSASVSPPDSQPKYSRHRVWRRPEFYDEEVSKSTCCMPSLV